MTYLILNSIFMAIILVILIILQRVYSVQRLSFRALVLMLLLTAVFDSLLIGFGIVEYDYSKTIGIKIGLAPIEDFSYTVTAWAIVPFIWSALELKKGRLDEKS